ASIAWPSRPAIAIPVAMLPSLLPKRLTTCPDVGQCQRGGGEVGIGVVVDDGVVADGERVVEPDDGVPAVRGGVEAVRGRVAAEPGDRVADVDAGCDAGRAAFPVPADAAVVSDAGGVSRIRCPTRMKFGSSIRFQRARSR